jgi:hypothetical protein
MHGLMREGRRIASMVELFRHRQTKGAETDKLGLTMRGACSLLYPSWTDSVALHPGYGGDDGGEC